MPSEDQLVQAYRALGWNDVGSILGDIRAGHWQDKWNNYLNMKGGGGQQAAQTTGGGIGETDPFVGATRKALEFDEAAARAVAEQEWNPYYDKMLQDYMQGYNIGQARSAEDLALALANINRQAPLVQERIGGQAADAGLYFSGQRQEAQQLASEQAQREREAAQREQTRYTEDIERQRLQYERELARQREQAITGQVETQRGYQYGGYA